MAVSLPVPRQEMVVKVALVAAGVAAVGFAIWYFVLRHPSAPPSGDYHQGYYQGVIDALMNAPGAGTIGGLGQVAPGGGGSAALGSGQPIAPGVLPTGAKQAYRPPTGGGQA